MEAKPGIQRRVDHGHARAIVVAGDDDVADAA
jgi:hypothetical protein